MADMPEHAGERALQRVRVKYTTPVLRLALPDAGPLAPVESYDTWAKSRSTDLARFWFMDREGPARLHIETQRHDPHEHQ